MVFVAGCAQTLVPVEGTVTIEGKGPLTQGEVVYYPDGSAGKIPRGKIGSDGKYHLETDGKAGAPPGKYKVTINPDVGVIPEAGKETVATKEIIDRANRDLGSTPHSKEVKSGAAPGTYDPTGKPAK